MKEMITVGSKTEETNAFIHLFHGNRDNEMMPIFEFNQGKESFSDFGNCFYTTDKEESASIWAYNIYGEQEPYVHYYALNTTGLKILDLREDDVFLNFIATLFKYRQDKVEDLGFLHKYNTELFTKKYALDVSDYDLIITKGVDDSYPSYLKGFASSGITLQQIKDITSQMNYGDQYAIKSEKAYSLLIPSNEPKRIVTPRIINVEEEVTKRYNCVFKDESYLENVITIRELSREDY